MTDQITVVEVSDASEGVKTVEINTPGLQGPASVFYAATFTGAAAPAGLTLRPVAEGSDVFELTLSLPE
ncbi:hypothetical protein [Pleomorphomonas oryzae]|uniref:hypothetical protein n=1 Tax=Pleomorphomonas oryzae TaxID=261934 RepID=UPI000401A59D|nr:hypothetical protein [Pleomorphomonas oryzae]